MASAFLFRPLAGWATAPADVPLPELEEGLPLVEHIPSEAFRGLGVVANLTVRPDGVIAFTSTAAVYLYDRASFTRVSVPTTYVNVVRCDQAGTLWVGGDALIGVIEPDPATGAPHFVLRLEQLPAGQRDVGVVSELTLGDDGAMYATTEHGVARFGTDGSTRWWTIPVNRFPLLHVAGNQVVHASTPTGVSLLEKTGVRQLVPAGKIPQGIADLLPGAAGHVQILAHTGDVFDCDLATGALVRFPTPLDRFLHAHPGYAVTHLPDGRTAMLLIGGGGIMLVERGWTRARILGKAQGLGSGSVTGMAPDAEGGLWLATGNGITRLQVGSGVTLFDERSGVTSTDVWDLARHEGTLYAASAAGLLQLSPSRPGEGTPAHFMAETRMPFGVNALLSTKEGLLLGTGTGVELLPREGESLRVLKLNESVRTLVASQRDPSLTFVCSDHGLYVLRRAGTEYVTYGPLAPAIAFWSATEDRDGTLWSGTRVNGIVRVSPPLDGDWNHAVVTNFGLGTAGLPANKGWTSTYTAFGEMQFLADDGTHRWDPQTQTFPLDLRPALDGQHDVRTYPVVTDSQHRAWTSPWHGVVACSRPLGWFDPNRTWHDAPDVAVSAIGFYGAGRMLLEQGSSEILWARGNNGLVRLDLNELAAAVPPKDWVTSIRSVRAASRTWPLASAVQPAFPFARDPIVFRFSAPRHRPGAGVRYRTRLLGFDSTWSAPDAAVEREFTNISGGPFTFEAKAVDASGHESGIARYAFSVTPPWYLRPIALVLYGVGAFALIFAFIRWRLGRSVREQRRLEALVATRTSELATARDAAEAANRAKSAFLASMSHELRTPLNGVIGYSQVLQNDPRLAPDQQERLRIVQSSGEHLLRMINDVLDLAKIEAGKVTLRPAPCALGDLLRDIAASHAPAAAAKNLAFHTQLAADLPAWVECDAQKLRQVLDNLLGNAVKFTNAGAITLAVRPAGHARIEFLVRDTGAGISALDQTRLFQAFEQAQEQRPDAPGAGLGLAISRALVGRLGGALVLTSAPGAGSTFSFTVPLPECEAPASVAQGRRLAGYEGAPRRALIIDDHDINRRLLIDLLTPLGFICSDFAVPRVALTRLTDGDEPWPDIAIVDVRMAEIDGLEFTRALRRLPRGPQLKVLLTSASVLSFNLEDGRRAGAEDFIAKPFRAAELLEKVGQLLGLRWRDADSPPTPASSGSAAPLPSTLRAELREHLAQGDLEALRTRLAELRAVHSAAALDALDEAAARFDLPRLRTLLS